MKNLKEEEEEEKKKLRKMQSGTEKGVQQN